MKRDRLRSRPQPGRSAPGPGSPAKKRLGPGVLPVPIPAWRDPWAWASLLAVAPLAIHSLGAPLGEPVAEDFDFLHRALFSRFTLLDGGGSEAFWRPLPHQIYYRALAWLILDHPGLIAALHATLLAVATVLIYGAFRRGWPPAWAAVIATFPLLSESTRTVISWPSHFVEIGLWLFTALALHEAAARRPWTTLGALLAALLCKEVAVVPAGLIPWLPGIGPRDRRERLRWSAATGALALAWAAAYWVIRKRAGLRLPHDLEGVAAAGGTPFLSRIGWAAGNSLRALFSLPAASSVWAGPLAVAVALLAAIALALTLARRRHIRAGAPALALWGLAWFFGASATMAPIFPLWAPNRSLYGSLGVGALAAAFFGTAQAWLLGALVVVRLAAFAVSPGPPPTIALDAPQRGAFLDFERLVRLQRLMRETRSVLEKAYPKLPSGARLGIYNLPWKVEYAFGGSQSLHVWYRDTTLRWVRASEFTARPEIPLLTIVEYDVGAERPVVLLNPEAMRELMGAIELGNQGDWAGEMVRLDRADSMEHDAAARAFRGWVAGARSLGLANFGRFDEAEREARRSTMLYLGNPNAHLTLGLIAYYRRRWAEADAEVDTILRFNPGNTPALDLRAAIRKAEGPGSR